MINSYLINLEKDASRLAFFISQFSELGLTFQRVPAVDGRQLSQTELTSLRKERPRNGEKSWLPGQLGCLLSHLAAWERIAAGEDRFAAVFEDDIHVSPALRTLLSDQSWIPDSVDLVRLEPSTSRVRLSKHRTLSHCGRDFFEVRSSSWCSGAYLINRRTAQRLVNLAPEHHQPTDILLFSREDSTFARELRVLQCQPAPCIQDRFLNPESITFTSGIELKKKGPAKRLMKRMRLLTPASVIRAVVRSLLNYRRVTYQ